MKIGGQLTVYEMEPHFNFHPNPSTDDWINKDFAIVMGSLSGITHSLSGITHSRSGKSKDLLVIYTIYKLDFKKIFKEKIHKPVIIWCFIILKTFITLTGALTYKRCRNLPYVPYITKKKSKKSQILIFSIFCLISLISHLNTWQYLILVWTSTIN